MKETNDQTKGLMRDCFFVRQGERRERCFYSEILYVEASGCYCYIHRRDKPRLSIAYPLLMLEPFLARGYVPAGTPELYREPLRSGWLYRESDLYRQERASSQSTLPSGGLRVF